MLTDQMRAEGWREHDGGRQPLHGSKRVAVMFRDGMIKGLERPYHARTIPWEHAAIGWKRPELHIIAYKPENPDG